ncbi:MAG: hypothetical protein M0P69_21715 [Bacteroidales bacterium]|nr:hypothetical protein [Bacteroidales bacterium]
MNYSIFIERRSPSHVWFYLRVNGGVTISKPQCMRSEEFDDYCKRLNATIEA